MSSYARLLRSIWTDPDFRALPESPQRLYMLLLSQPDVSHCGVLPFTPRRWGSLASDTDTESTLAAMVYLTLPETVGLTVSSPFVLVDEETEEILIRSYAKHDEGYKVPNIRKALLRSVEEVLSAALRAAIVRQLATLGVTVPETHSETVGLLHRQPLPLPTPAAAASNGSTNGRSTPTLADWLHSTVPATDAAAAAAAFEQWITWRVGQPDVKHPARLERTLRVDAIAEWHTELVEYFARHPGADTDTVLFDVFRLNPTTGERRST